MGTVVQTWIFQGNPDEFDLDAYFASRPGQLTWLATRYASEISVGDRVYIWRNQGASRAVPGVIAECVVTAEALMQDVSPASLHFWRSDGPRVSTPQMRVTMRLVRVANRREVLRRDWCLEDPILSDLPNLRMQAGTNYKLGTRHAQRLDALWNRTGRDWNYNEAVAGMWAYAETYGEPVSQLPGTPVSNVSVLIGRAVSGVYAKIMNFRSIDPRADGAGMSGAGKSDRFVWRNFFDPIALVIRREELDAEFKRLWGMVKSEEEFASDVNALVEAVNAEADRLGNLPLAELLARYSLQKRDSGKRPDLRVSSSRVYERNPLVVAIARARANYQCEVPGCRHPLFLMPNGQSFVEVHHIEPLADGGVDTIENVVCLCPSHHREVHLGVAAPELTAQLRRDRTLHS